MKTLRIPLSVCVLALFAALAGCGGGSSSSGGSGSISGRVSDLIALPGPGRAAGDAVRISVEGTGLSATTNPDGSFTINGVPAGLQTVIVRTTTHAAAFCARVSPGSNTAVGEIALREAGQISGLVSSADDHRPIPEARVTVTELIYTNTADIAPHPVRALKTNGSGSYTVDGLPAGEYLVTVDKEGFETESLMTYVSPFSTTPGDLQLHAADPAAKGVMAGTAYLVSEDGQRAPVAGVLVRVIPGGTTRPPSPLPLPGDAIGSNGESVDLYAATGRSHSYREHYTFTDETGAYSLDGIPAGEYIAEAVRPGLEPEQKSVTITASGTTTVDFQLQLRQPRAGIIEGRVVNAENGSPVANAHVTLLYGPMPMPIGIGAPATGGGYSSPGSVGGGSPGMIGGGSGGIYIEPDEFDFYAVTDAEGRFKMRAPAGEVLVDVYAEGFLPTQQAVQVPLRGTVAAEVRLTKHVTREVTLSGRVVTATSNGAATPVANATVWASPISDHVHIMGGLAGSESAVVRGGSRMHPFVMYKADTDSDGRFSLKLQSGAYYLYASKDNLYSEPLRMDIVNDATQDFVVKEDTATDPPNR